MDESQNSLRTWILSRKTKFLDGRITKVKKTEIR
jgi:hypothetical protein